MAKNYFENKVNYLVVYLHRQCQCIVNNLIYFVARRVIPKIIKQSMNIVYSKRIYCKRHSIVLHFNSTMAEGTTVEQRDENKIFELHFNRQIVPPQLIRSGDKREPIRRGLRTGRFFEQYEENMGAGPGREAQRIDFYLDANGLIIPTQSSGKNNQEWLVLPSRCKAAILFGEKRFFLGFHYNENMGRCGHIILFPLTLAGWVSDALPPSLV